MNTRACQHVLPLVALSLASSCAFDARPSLGWDKHAESLPLDAAVSDARFEADGDAALEAGDASDGSDANASGASASPVSCPTGLYVGQFACQVDAAPVGAVVEIDFTLEQRAPDSPEATVDGPILFTSGGGLMIADFTARLDCTTGAFHADLSNGFALVVPIPVLVPFVGAMDGEIDPDAGALAGEWRIELPPGTAFGALGTCAGAWRAPLPR